MAKTSVPLGALAAANLLIVFLTQGYVLITLGPGILTDALFAAQTLPQVLTAIATGPLIHVFVPLLSTQTESRLRQEAWTVATLAGGIMIALAAAMAVSAAWWVPLLVPGFSSDAISLTVTLARIHLIAMVFTVLAALLGALHHARRQFVPGELPPLFANATGCGLLLWALPEYGITAAAWTSVMSVVFQTLLLTPALGRYEAPNWRSDTLYAAWRRLKPLLLGAAYYKTEPLIDRLLASLAPTGNLSLLALGQQIYGGANFLAYRSVASPSLTELASYAHRNQWGPFYCLYRSRLALLCGIGSGLVAFMLVLGHPLLHLCVGYGEVTEQHATDMWWISIGLGGVLIGGMGGQITSSAFYARGNTRLPAMVGIIGFTVGSALKVLGLSWFGIIGVAVATSLYYCLNATVMHLLLDRTRHGDERVHA